MHVVPDFNRFLSRRGDPNGGPYSDRDSYSGSILGVLVSEHKDYDGVEYNGPLPAYAVVVGYQTGDTFGYDYQAQVMDVFEDEKTAENLAKAIESTLSNLRKYSFDFNGKTYRAPWVGYFERLDSVGVFRVEKALYRRKF